MSFTRAPVRIVRSFTIIDLLLFFGILFFFYSFAGVAGEMTGPFRSKIEIDLSLRALPFYAFFSLMRGFTAYGLSLIFSLFYGYFAAHSKHGEKILIAILDILQSIPIMALLPALVLSLVALFPHNNVGLEAASILMIFNGQVWNMIFSFYSSVKTVPLEIREVTQVYQFSKWDTLRKVEIPLSMNGLLWNSMLSMAGGWFFLMVAESFTLGDKDFRLPGIGSYIAVAYETQNNRAMVAGLIAMLLIIIVVDRFLWAPLVNWSERFRLETLAEKELGRNWAAWARKSVILRLLAEISDWVKRRTRPDTVAAIRERKAQGRTVASVSSRWGPIAKWLLIAVLVIGIVRGASQLLGLLWVNTPSTYMELLRDTFLTLLRVIVSVVLGSLWTIPLGVWIGIHPKWTQRLQPIVQVTASFPYPMVYPLLATFLVSLGVEIDLGAVALMILGSQWYILFNVISGATRIPLAFFDIAQIFRLRGWTYWRSIILPGIFPDLVTGWITAAGGAWNACIVTELVQNGPTRFMASGIGASITQAATQADYPRLAAAVVIMTATVVGLNFIFWGQLYRLADTKYRLDSVT
ncbi:MAG: ABC transporter permease subunit [Deltaproteobacteria bacterium]|nr:ABC transporter permease subunit [Deltaproteobacteria bacterium]MBI3296234.1 ABC transporter permease subunit [Deltaproteobacteria bacterium]